LVIGLINAARLSVTSFTIRNERLISDKLIELIRKWA
jgi:hypothetical protein